MVNENDRENPECEGVLVGYTNAIRLWIYGGQAMWARFNIILLVNGIIIGALTINPSTNKLLILMQNLLPYFGIILCLIWFMQFKRNHDYHKYYILSAREIEENFLNDNIEVVSRGGIFGEGREVTLIINGQRKKLKLRTIFNFRGEWSGISIIILFLIFYGVIIYFNLNP